MVSERVKSIISPVLAYEGYFKILILKHVVGWFSRTRLYFDKIYNKYGTKEA